MTEGNFPWGNEGVDEWIPTLHSTPYPAIDPTQVNLPRPFIVCIIGASRGIGMGIATSYVSAGAGGIVLAARRISGLEETAEKCRSIKSDIELELVHCDITSAESVENLSRVTRERFGGRLDVVVVNSGFSGPVVLKLTETDPETFQQAINVNYVGTFLCAKFLIPLLIATEDGARAFLAVSSTAPTIVRGPIANAQYNVSKSAQWKLIEHIHEQYHPTTEGGISAYAVHPGAVLTEMAAQSAPEEFKQYLTESVDLCGASCVWLTKDGDKNWLSGKWVSSLWDVDELVKRKEEIISRNLLRLHMTL